jgi:hypothetical protein
MAVRPVAIRSTAKILDNPLFIELTSRVVPDPKEERPAYSSFFIYTQSWEWIVDFFRKGKLTNTHESPSGSYTVVYPWACDDDRWSSSWSIADEGVFEIRLDEKSIPSQLINARFRANGSIMISDCRPEYVVSIYKRVRQAYASPSEFPYVWKLIYDVTLASLPHIPTISCAIVEPRNERHLWVYPGVMINCRLCGGVSPAGCTICMSCNREFHLKVDRSAILAAAQNPTLTLAARSDHQGMSKKVTRAFLGMNAGQADLRREEVLEGCYQCQDVA